MFDRIRRDEDGFTLIELLVVVIIIGILAAIAIPTFLNQRESAWRASVESDLRNLATNMETCYANTGAYTDPADVAAAAGATNTANGVCAGVDLNLSDGTGIAVTVNGQNYVITGSHVNLTETVDYNSATGGLGAWS